MPMLLEGPFLKTAEDQKTESAGEEGGDGNEAVTSSDVAPVQIYDDETDVRLLICSGTSKPVSPMPACHFCPFTAMQSLGE